MRDISGTISRYGYRLGEIVENIVEMYDENGLRVDYATRLRLVAFAPKVRIVKVVCQPIAAVPTRRASQRCQNQAVSVLTGTRRRRSAPGARKNLVAVSDRRTAMNASR